LGCNGYEGDALPIDINRLEARTFVGEVVMKTETTALLAAARKLGCRTQIGTDMLFEQIPAYLIWGQRRSDWGVPTFAFENEPFFGEDWIDTLRWCWE
jgi:shikimate 5-dehydrogenase